MVGRTLLPTANEGKLRVDVYGILFAQIFYIPGIPDALLMVIRTDFSTVVYWGRSLLSKIVSPTILTRV